MAADLSIHLPGPGAASYREPDQMSPPRRAGDNEAFSFWGIRIPVAGAVRVAESLGRVGFPGLLLLGIFGMAGAAGVRYGDPLVNASIERDRAMTAVLNRIVEGQPETLKLLQMIHEDSIKTQQVLAELLSETRKRK